MIEYVAGLKAWVTAVERGGNLDAMIAEPIILALDTLALAVTGAESTTFAPMVQHLGGLLLSDDFAGAYAYCVEIAPALAGKAG